MSGNDNSASSFGPPISATVNDSNNHQNDETHQQRQSGIPEHGSGKCQSMSPVRIDREQDSNSMLGTFPAKGVLGFECQTGGRGGGGVLKLLKKFTTQTKNWSNGCQFCSWLLFSYSNMLYTVYRLISDS